MQSQTKMLSSGTAASSRSLSVRSAGAARTVATLTGRSVDGGAEDGTRIEVGLAPHEPARHLCQRAGVDDEAEPLARGIRNRHEDGVGPRSREDLLDRFEASENRRSLQAPAREARVVVDETDNLLARGLAELAQEAAPASAG